MCVALIITGSGRPTVDELKAMEQANQDGAGVGWADNGGVHWKKGLGYREVSELIETLPRPIFVHFRLATAGGSRAELCHPFPVNPEADVRIVGSSGALMMHNGHWGSWDDWFRALNESGVPTPEGPWSDTRFAAYMMAHWPREHVEIAKLTGGRVALLRGNGTFSLWGDWHKPDNDGVIYSNYHWAVCQSAYDWGDDEWRGGWGRYESIRSEAVRQPTDSDAEEKAREARLDAIIDRNRVRSYDYRGYSNRSRTAVTAGGTRYLVPRQYLSSDFPDVPADPEGDDYTAEELEEIAVMMGVALDDAPRRPPQSAESTWEETQAAIAAQAFRGSYGGRE